MKKIYIALLAMATALASVTGCKTEEPFFTAGEDDFPKILNTDIQEANGGKPCALANISRDANFTMDIIVTPTAYTTVSWYFDGVKVFEGASIDMPLLAGDYNVKIVATTTKGKETYRNCTLKVLPLDGDPELAADAKSRWLNPGAAGSISGTGIASITTLDVQVPKNIASKADDELYDYVAVENFSNDGSKISFTVPETLPEGEFRLVATDDSGAKFGCGLVTVSTEKYVEPGKVEKVLWEGSSNLNWDAESIKLTAEQLADVPVGTKIQIYYEKIDASLLAEVYYALRIVEPSWTNDLDILPQTDFGPIEDNPYELEYTAARKEVVESKGSMSLVGNGLKITKISYMAASASSEFKLWEGSSDLNWDAENIKITADKLADVAVDSEIQIFYEKIDASLLAEVYYALRIVEPSWTNDLDILPQTDFGPIEDNPYILKYTAARKEVVESKGSMSLVGNGLKITKVSVK